MQYISVILTNHATFVFHLKVMGTLNFTVIRPARSGYITTPGYPNAYPSNFRWRWTLITDYNHTLVGRVYAFRTLPIQSNSTHSWCTDYVEFQFTASINGVNAIKYCDFLHPIILYGPSRTIHIILQTAATVLPNSGFRVGYALRK